MDVDQIAFSWQLSQILKILTSAHFVALDLELSGIHSKPIHRGQIVSTSRGNKQTLQERYEEAKAAAEKYQVLQVGLTVVQEDTGRGKFITCL